MQHVAVGKNCMCKCGSLLVTCVESLERFPARSVLIQQKRFEGRSLLRESFTNKRMSVCRIQLQLAWQIGEMQMRL